MTRKKLIIAYHNTFQSPEGKIVLEDLLKQAVLVTEGVNHRNGVDANRLLVMEGEANIVKRIYYMLKQNPLEERPAKAKNQGE